MNNNIKFSVVIPTYSRDEKLLKALDSVASQNYKFIEIIVVNDNIYDLIIKKKYPYPISIVNSGGKKGGSHCRNLGIDISSGDYIAFLDDDDFWKPNYLLQSANIIKNSAAKFISCSYSTYISFFGIIFTLKNFHPNEKKIYKYNSLFGASCMIVSRELLFQVGKFDIRLISCQDWDLWIKLIRSGEKFEINEESLVLYQRHLNASITKSFRNRYVGLRKFYFKHGKILDEIVLIQLLVARYAFNTANIKTLCMCKSPIKLYLQVLIQKFKYLLICK
jgi:glycosyltransferase involved in cell wall biosynthesis